MTFLLFVTHGWLRLHILKVRRDLLENTLTQHQVTLSKQHLFTGRT